MRVEGENNGVSLSDEERRRMLREIGEVALAVGREIYPAQFDALEVESGRTPGALTGRERLALLGACMPAIERAIRRIGVEPRTGLRREIVEMPAARARRPLPRAVVDAIRRGNMRPVTASPLHPSLPFLAARLGGFLPRSLAEDVLTLTTDTPENRYIAAALSGWRRELRVIAALAEWEGDADTGAQAHLLEARLRRSADLIPCAEPALESESDPPVTTMRPTDNLLRDARYRTIYELDRRLHRLFRYAWDAPALILPPKEAWLLYEMWCFFQTAAALRGLGWRAVGGDVVRITRGRLSVTLAKGQASALRFRRGNRPTAHCSRLTTHDSVTLFYNRAFPSAAVGSREASSRTHTMIPDISLESKGRLLLLDSKFRAYTIPGDEQEDIVKMHAYRDAIVKGGKQVVDGAWCLYPGTPDGGTQVISYPSNNPEKPFGTAGIGAILLRPGRETVPLARLLEEWFTTR